MPSTAVALDSLEKIMYRYIRTFACQVFTFDGKTVAPPAHVIVTPLVFRGYTCPSECGGCCPRFSLVYLPFEMQPCGVKRIDREFNGKLKPFWSDSQDDNKSRFCGRLDRNTGRCTIYQFRPFSCDFELIRAIISTDSVRVQTSLFGRGHIFKTVDGNKGAKCEITPPTSESVNEVTRKFFRLKEWCDYVEVHNHLDKVLEWCKDEKRRMLPLELTNEVPN